MLKYERLPIFCFYCGKIGYGENFCDRRFENEFGVVELVYGPEL